MPLRGEEGGVCPDFVGRSQEAPRKIQVLNAIGLGSSRCGGEELLVYEYDPRNDWSCNNYLEKQTRY
jgi:hypothetical protein